MQEKTGPKPGDLETLKSVALEIISRVEGNAGSGQLLASGVNSVSIHLSDGDAKLDVEISAARRICKTEMLPFACWASSWPGRP